MCVFSGSFLRGAAGGSGASSRVSPGGAPPLFCDDDTDILRETLSLKNTRRKSVNRASTLNWYTNRGATRDPRQATHELLHRDTALCASEADQEHSAVIFSVPHRYGLVQ